MTVEMLVLKGMGMDAAQACYKSQETQNQGFGTQGKMSGSLTLSYLYVINPKP